MLQAGVTSRGDPTNWLKTKAFGNALNYLGEEDDKMGFEYEKLIVISAGWDDP